MTSPTHLPPPETVPLRERSPALAHEGADQPVRADAAAIVPSGIT